MSADKQVCSQESWCILSDLDIDLVLHVKDQFSEFTGKFARFDHSYTVSSCLITQYESGGLWICQIKVLLATVAT